MARLISSDSLLEKIHDTAEGLADCDQQNAAWALMKYAVRDIMDEETVDAVEVVRCRDCKHYDKGFCVGYHAHHDIMPDDFCSYGERKDSNGNG